MKHLFIVLAVFSFKSQAIEVEFEEDNAIPIVYLNVVIRSGAVADPKDQSGITQFTGQMLLRGTSSRTKEQISLALDEMGAQLGVDARSEVLILRGAVLSENLPAFLSLLSEVLTSPSFPKDQIRKLKNETISRILESLGNDRYLARQRFEEQLFKGHPYSQPTAGLRRSIKRLKREQLQEHFDRLVQSNNILVVGTGASSTDVVAKWANSLGKARPGGRLSLDVSAPISPPGRRLVIIDKPDRTQTQVNIGHVGVTMTDPNYFPLYLGMYAFGGYFQSRIMSELRIKRGWTYGAYSYFRHGTQPRSWITTFFPANKDTPAAIEYSIQMLEDLANNGITEKEFEFARNSLINNSKFRYNTPKKRVENIVSVKVQGLPKDFFESFGDQISDVSRDQVNAALKTFINTDKLLVAVLATSSKLKDDLVKSSGVSKEKTEVIPYDKE